MHVIRWGFKLMWQGAARKMRRYKIGEVNSFDKKNAHGGIIWGWPKECRLTNFQAGEILFECYKSKKFTLPMMKGIRKSLAYAYELTGGEPKSNYPKVKSNWEIVRGDKLPGITMTQKPESIPTPEDLKKFFNKRWTKDHPWGLMDFLGGLVAAQDLFLFGLRSREDIDRVKKSFIHEFNWDQGWQCTSFVGGRAKLSGTKKGTRQWWVWRVCCCKTKTHTRPPPDYCQCIDKKGNPTNFEKVDDEKTEKTEHEVPFDTCCPLAALELMWQLQPKELGVPTRSYGKWLDSGRYGKHNVNDVAEFAIDWFVTQGADEAGYDTNAGRKSLARLTEHLNIPYDDSFHNHGDLWEVFQRHYAEGVERSNYPHRVQSRDPAVATRCMRRIAKFLGAGMKVKVKLDKQSRFAYHLLKALGLKAKASRIKQGLPSDSESDTDEEDQPVFELIRRQKS